LSSPVHPGHNFDTRTALSSDDLPVIFKVVTDVRPEVSSHFEVVTNHVCFFCFLAINNFFKLPFFIFHESVFIFHIPFFDFSFSIFQVSKKIFGKNLIFWGKI
jgi:hypothetical protein